ncbi:flagellar basal-body MS-ring/collar protein FliF [Algiphilus aromaticivorans]|jgi:flagellar M-ring protein FliF|uniref:flagellar basal-body MS-ring/collar protein FliF n=1 Tax=Algiphilus aromaticivorans TaxID=382454 RepID=UPI0005C1A3B6|nr:flagellar basal-body MS-ring/collar protein FliF [Algiphilus aromaticivorans]
MAQGTFPGLQQLAPFKPVLLLAGLALAIAAGISIYMWSRGTDWTPVTSGVELSTASGVARELESAGIPARVAASGDSVQVPRTQLHAARMQLAGSDNLGGAGGFSMLSESPGFGVSQFMESARYQYALETELARTVASLSPVRSARVHLATARDSAFVRDRSRASASVVVELRSGRRLDAAQAQAIVNLLAASVPDMAPEAVTVVDSAGNLLSRREGDETAFGTREQFDLARQTEAMLASRIVGMLEAVVGEGRVRAQVTVEHEPQSTQRASERLDSEAPVITRERLREEREGVGRQGEPAGAAANMPGEPEAAAGEPPAGAAGDGPSMRNVERDYVVGREYVVESVPAGSLRRISAAVLVDQMPVIDAEGNATTRAPEPAELAQLRQLVEGAIGFDAERGDRLSIEHARFATPLVGEGATPQAASLWEQAVDDGWLQMALRNFGGVLLLLVLIFTVLRPTLRALLQPVTVDAATDRGDQLQLAGHGETAEAYDEAPSVREAPYERQLQAARSVVQQDPKRVAQLMRTWVGNDG